MPERPLTDREVAVLRGMIDEYEFARRRRQLRGKRLSAWERLVVTIAALWALLIPLVNLLLNLRVGH